MVHQRLKSLTDKGELTLQRLNPCHSHLHYFNKVHKELHPIVCTIGNSTYMLAKCHLATIFSPIVGQTSLHIKNSKQFVERVELVIQISWLALMLFTNIPVLL